MFIKPSKKWRNPEGDQTIMVPYTYCRLCESYREADGKVKQRTVLGLGELLEFPTDTERKELADLLTSLINQGTGSMWTWIPSGRIFCKKIATFAPAKRLFSQLGRAAISIDF